MATTATKTVRQLCTQALQRAQVTGYRDAPEAADLEAAITELNMMLKAWQAEGNLLWTYTTGSLALTTATSYTLSPARPMRVLSARLKSNGIEMPMVELTREEYDALPDKDTTGTPTQFYYDRQREDALFYVWPALASTNGETVEYTYERELEDVTDGSEALDMPGEWWEATMYGLAARLAEAYMMTNALAVLGPRATTTLERALGWEREGSVFFAGPYADA
jgi:hypothetical protein